MRHYQRLLGYLRPYIWPRGVLAVICMLAFSGIESSIPFVAKYTFDQVFTEQQLEALPFAIVGVLVLAIGRGVLDFAAKYLSDWVGQRIVTDLRNALTAHMQRLDLAFFNRQRAGQIVSRVTVGRRRSCAASVTDAVVSIFQDSTRLIGLTAVAIYMDWVLALCAVCLFPIAAIPIRYFSSALRQNSRRQQEAVGRLNALLHENVQGNRVVKAFGQEALRAEAPRATPASASSTSSSAAAASARCPSPRSSPASRVAGIVWYGGTSVIAGTRTQGAFLGFVITLFLLYEPFKRLVTHRLHDPDRARRRRPRVRAARHAAAGGRPARRARRSPACGRGSCSRT